MVTARRRTREQRERRADAGQVVRRRLRRAVRLLIAPLGMARQALALAAIVKPVQRCHTRQSQVLELHIPCTAAGCSHCEGLCIATEQQAARHVHLCSCMVGEKGYRVRVLEVRYPTLQHLWKRGTGWRTNCAQCSMSRMLAPAACMHVRLCTSLHTAWRLLLAWQSVQARQKALM